MRNISALKWGSTSCATETCHLVCASKTTRRYCSHYMVLVLFNARWAAIQIIPSPIQTERPHWNYTIVPPRSVFLYVYVDDFVRRYDLTALQDITECWCMWKGGVSNHSTLALPHHNSMQLPFLVISLIQTTSEVQCQYNWRQPRLEYMPDQGRLSIIYENIPACGANTATVCTHNTIIPQLVINTVVGFNVSKIKTEGPCQMFEVQ
jgi:hypothetical protein